MKKIVISILVICLLSSVGIYHFCIKKPAAPPEAEHTSTDADAENEEEDFIITDGTQVDYDDDDDEEDENRDKNKIIVDTKVSDTDDNHYTANVTINNVSDRLIDDWEISFHFNDTIENIQNGQIMEQKDNFYTVKNTGANADIAAGDSVTFGLSVKYEGKKDTIRDFYLTRERFEVDEDRYKVTYKESGRQGHTVNGKIVIKNESKERIEDWKLELLGNLTIKEIRDAEIVDDGQEELIVSTHQNKYIEPGGKVSFTFTAVCDDKQVEIYNDTVYEMIRIPEELKGNPDWVDEYELGKLARYELERDDFETEEAYQKYVAKRKSLGYKVVDERKDFEDEDDDDDDYEVYPPED